MLINAYLLICLLDCIFVYYFVNRQGIVLSATRNATISKTISSS